MLATGTNDAGTDTVRAFEVADREPAAVTQAVDFSGNITALWTESDGGNAIAVVRD